MMTRTDRRQRGRDQQRRAKMMNHGREKREVRERKEGRKLKKESLVNINFFFFFFFVTIQLQCVDNSSMCPNFLHLKSLMQWLFLCVDGKI